VTSIRPINRFFVIPGGGGLGPRPAEQIGEAPEGERGPGRRPTYIVGDLSGLNCLPSITVVPSRAPSTRLRLVPLPRSSGEDTRRHRSHRLRLRGPYGAIHRCEGRADARAPDAVLVLTKEHAPSGTVETRPGPLRLTLGMRRRPSCCRPTPSRPCPTGGAQQHHRCADHVRDALISFSHSQDKVARRSRVG